VELVLLTAGAVRERILLEDLEDLVNLRIPREKWFSGAHLCKDCSN
jgi:hypothetical protein